MAIALADETAHELGSMEHGQSAAVAEIDDALSVLDGAELQCALHSILNGQVRECLRLLLKFTCFFHSLTKDMSGQCLFEQIVKSHFGLRRPPILVMGHAFRRDHRQMNALARSGHLGKDTDLLP